MDDEIKKLVESLNVSPVMLGIACAGAGSQAVKWLLGCPGASRTVLEAVMPYSPNSLAEFLGKQVDQAVSKQTALQMAGCTYRRALRLRSVNNPVLGIGCTATISTDRIKAGRHHCHVAIWDGSGSTVYSLEFSKSVRDRQDEEKVVSRLIMKSLAESIELDLEVTLDLVGQECVDIEKIRYRDSIAALMANHVESVTIQPDGTMESDAQIPKGVLSGSFNPLHSGHVELATVASEILVTEVVFELSIRNADKPSLEDSEIHRRVSEMGGCRPIIVVWPDLFLEKARLFPGCVFVIGVDTAARLFDLGYYGGEEIDMILAFEEIRNLGCRFLVAGRVTSGRFLTLDDLYVPDRFRDIVESIPESKFRSDISSTDLRA